MVEVLLVLEPERLNGEWEEIQPREQITRGKEGEQ